jgi:hypothetical protein
MVSRRNGPRLRGRSQKIRQLVIDILSLVQFVGCWLLIICCVAKAADNEHLITNNEQQRTLQFCAIAYSHLWGTNLDPLSVNEIQ